MENMKDTIIKKVNELIVKRFKTFSYSLSHQRLVLIMSLLCLYCIHHTVQAKTYVFVSYSMNDGALQAYFKEAIRDKAVLVMRGLAKDSFQETKARCDKLSIAYNIDPELFDTYGVKVVPTIVRDTKGVIKKITGHIPLREALKIFKGGQ